jgi:orotate phosphoribosyltransferase
MTDSRDAVSRLLSARRGHYLLESGHHGELWLDLEVLCLRPRVVRALAMELAGRLRQLEIDAVCGPLIEGAFVAMMVAEELDVPFTYAEGRADPDAQGLFPVRYLVPTAQRPQLTGRRVAVVNDVVNAGSAVRGTVADLQACGARLVVIGSLAVLGESAARFAQGLNVPLLALASLPNQIWTAAECPLCARGVPLDSTTA